MKIFFLSFITTFTITSCGPQPQTVYVHPSTPVVVQQTDPVGNYQIMTDAYGHQVVYYTDPYSNLSYYLEYSVFNSLIYGDRPYYAIHNYYLGHRDYITRSYNTYHTSYTRSYYNSRSDNGARFRRSVPNNPSSSAYRPSVPSGRTTGYSSSSTPRTSVPTGSRSSSSPYTTTRSSVPSGRSGSYSSGGSSSGSRRSMPSGRH